VCSRRLKGRRIVRLGRHGKHILFELDRGWLDVHLRMTGKLLLDGARTPYTRAALKLDTGELLFDDVRQFGRMEWRDSPPSLGPDWLGLELDEFVKQFAGRRSRLKPLLLNQAVFSGLGNIYVDEALHRAGLHPLVQAHRLTRMRLAKLHASIGQTLEEALALGGSSISNYVDGDGRPGLFQQRHRVYAREGEPCGVCGAAIRRIVVSQRGTHFCPRCQRLR
jgi:formamidopyrimidine-DNA glycosylase